MQILQNTKKKWLFYNERKKTKLVINSFLGIQRTDIFFLQALVLATAGG